MIYKRISQLANMQRRLIDKLARGKQYSGTEEKLIHYLFENSGTPTYQKKKRFSACVLPLQRRYLIPWKKWI